MKVLYVSPEQSDPSLSQALGTAGADVVVSSATQLGEAAHWIFSNLDLAALILDAKFGQPQCNSFLKNLRSRGLTVPLILIASEGADDWMDCLCLGADDCIVQKESLVGDAAGIVRRAVYRTRPSAAFTVLAGHVVDIHRQLERVDREHDLRIQVGDLTAAHAALHEQLTRTETALDRSTVRLASLAIERRELEGALDTAARELVSTRAERDGLRAYVDQSRQLQGQLDDMAHRVETEFDNFPLPLCRATRAGVITHANRAFGALLGCPSAGAKRRLTLASELFESSNELKWLVERSASSEDAPSVECTRRKVDDSRLILRLRAMAASDAIHIVIEDLTPNWILQAKLNRAQQMEAVGRMAAEVALTCVSFLQDATGHGRRLIATLEDNSEARRSSQQMVGEVDRVAASLRQLARYADDQAMSLEPVDLHQVLCDLEPILQELAGDDVQVVLPERPAREVPPFNVDVTAQRVERLLINLARYSRGRIASGGRMVFEIAATTVDGEFVAKYPNVRHGAHVLLTVTQDGAHASTAGGNGSGASVAATSGGDLSTLHGLVRHCGGHLWMDTDNTGETKIKIHLPLRAA
jgi:PAS domain-containing protein